MSRSAIIDSAEQLAWSLWTELGVSGVVRNHQLTVIDPEPLIVATPAMVEGEPRLRELVYGWCAAYSDRISTSRLRGLIAALPGSARAPFEAMVVTLRENGAVRWTIGDGGEPWPTVPEMRKPSLDLSRPSLLRLRLRGLCGVGARADVLCELIGRHGSWVRAADLEDEGYSKRNVARVLSEFQEAGIVVSQAKGHALRYRLVRPELLSELTGAAGLAHTCWRRVLLVALSALDFVTLEDRAAATRRVEAHKLAELMRPVAEELWLDSPPSTRGEVRAWDMMVEWFATQVQRIAEGTSPALAIEAVRAAELPRGREAWVWLSSAAPGRDRVDATLRHPEQVASGVRCEAIVQTDDRWTAYQLAFQPRLEPVAVRNKVEHLVAPLKVAWRSVRPGA